MLLLSKKYWIEVIVKCDNVFYNCHGPTLMWCSFNSKMWGYYSMFVDSYQPSSWHQHNSATLEKYFTLDSKSVSDCSPGVWESSHLQTRKIVARRSSRTWSVLHDSLCGYSCEDWSENCYIWDTTSRGTTIAFPFQPFANSSILFILC